MSNLEQRLHSALGDAYRIERELGGGGMSRVFLATERALNRAVVVKVLAPELTSEVLAARFRREFEVTATLGQHPHILAVLSTGTQGGLLYYISPFIEGESLRHRLQREQRLPVTDVVRILVELAGALAYAHERGVVHRDLKPENVLLSDGHAILADFGISGILAGAGHDPAEHGMRLTESGMAIGTPGYMSPEQASGEPVIDGRSDVYALAVVGYEMLTGTPPFTGNSPVAVMTAHLNETPRPIASLRPDAPLALIETLNRALAKKPDDRFASAAAFCEALSPDFSGERSLPGTTHASRGRRRVATLGIAALLAIAVSAVFAFRPGVQEVTQPNLVAVAPFETIGPEMEVWREGLIDLLSTNLDGAGPIRTVAPSVVVRRAPGDEAGRIDRTTARELGLATRAGITIFGRIIASGRDSVRVSATILEVESGRTTDIEYRDEQSRMDRVGDSLTVAILRELNRTQAIGATRRAAIGSSSLPAMKAYLRGEQFYRRSDWDSAAAHYERAVALDPDFAPALRHLSNALGWKLSPDMELTHRGYRYAILAGTKNRGLAPRESLLVAADSIFAALQLSSFKEAPGQRSRLIERVTAMLDDGVRRFPDDPEVWFKSADVHFHFTRFAFPSSSNLHVARQGFERSIALDAAFAPAYIHQVELAAVEQDVESLRRSTRAFLALDSHDVHGASMAMVQAMIAPDPRRTPVPDSVLRAASHDVLQNVFGTMMPLMDSAETQIRVARALAAKARSAEVPSQLRASARHALLNSLLIRGHVREALAEADSTESWVVAEAAMLRAIPGDSATRLLGEAIHRGGAQRPMTGAMYWATNGDTASLAALATLLRANRFPGFPRTMLPGLEAMARRDTSAAIAAFTFPDSACAGWCGLARFPLAFLLSAQRRDREAAALLDQDFLAGSSTRVLWTLERGRVNERLGERAKAIDSYLFVASAWRNADPALVPYVDEARRALRRLGTDRARRGSAVAGEG